MYTVIMLIGEVMTFYVVDELRTRRVHENTSVHYTHMYKNVLMLSRIVEIFRKFPDMSVFVFREVDRSPRFSIY